MTSIENKQQSLALALLENASFSRDQAEAIIAAIRLLNNEEPPKFPARILRFREH